jgi:hypothetical protein
MGSRFMPFPSTNDFSHFDMVFSAQGFLRHAHQDTVVNVLDDSQGLVRASVCFGAQNNIRLICMFYFLS